jgi:16S rRNA (adenine1518-N6/adenine1519-N6)-dimethyltransferase
VTAKKSLGQHFLTDENILRRIVDALDPQATDLVLEIGPGKGSLTRELMRRGPRVIGIEKDSWLAAELRGLGKRPGLGIGDSGLVTIVEGDALQLDWHELLHSLIPNPQSPIPFLVTGNIPYNITSPLIAKALTPPLPARIVFLVQREVAERLAAAPGSKIYGGLSVGVQAVCEVERLFTVKAGAFHPPPKVDSAVIRLTPRAEPLVAPGDVAAFRIFVTACFSRRRKQLRNVVAGATGQPLGVVSAGIATLGLDPASRPETLAPIDFVRLLHWSRQL